jgi:hypothetical protein
VVIPLTIQIPIVKRSIYVKTTQQIVTEDYTKIMNIQLRDPEHEYRSSITGITMD